MFATTMLTLTAVLLVATVSSWQANLWPTVSGSLSGVPPVAINDAVVVYPYSGGSIYAVNATTHELMWAETFDSVEALTSIPTENIILATGDGMVAAYDVPTGQPLWHNTSAVMAALSQTTPLVIGDAVIFSSQDYWGIMAFSAATGGMLYNTFLNFSGGVLLCELSGTAAGFINSNTLFAFDPTTGVSLWNFTDDALSFIVAGEGFVAVSRNTVGSLAPIDREVILLSASTGAIALQLHAMNGSARAPAFARIYNGRFYALVDGVLLQCYSLATGTMEWALPVAYAASTNAFSYHRDRIVMAAFDRLNYVVNYSLVDVQNGATILEWQPSGTTLSYAVWEDVLFVPHDDFSLSAYNTTNGKSIFDIHRAAGLSSSIMVVTSAGLTWVNATAVFGV